MSSRRATMTLFSTPDDPWSHRTRIVIAEKVIEIEIVDVAPGKYPEDLLDLNPYHTTPTLIDRPERLPLTYTLQAVKPA